MMDIVTLSKQEHENLLGALEWSLSQLQSYDDYTNLQWGKMMDILKKNKRLQNEQRECQQDKRQG